MCGIIGYVGHRRAVPVLLEGLRRLEYRGYDSAGLAFVDDGDMSTVRRVGRVADLTAAVPAEVGSNAGIAHTRWATHGGVTQENAHPHTDSTGRIAVVHNGIVENATALRAKLESEGIVFQSETDTEVIPHLISSFYDGDATAAVVSALSLIQGTYGVAVMFADDPDRIVVARNGSPLVIGLGDGETLVASDTQALVRYTRRVVFLEDGEIAEVDARGVVTNRLKDGPTEARVQVIEEEWGVGDKGDFPHYMAKEIDEQPSSIQRCLRGRVLPHDGNAKLGGLDLSPRDLLNFNRVVLLGCGTSYHACLTGAMAIERLARVPARAEIASEFRYRNPMIDPNTLYFAVSQSGETADTLGAIKEVQVRGGQAMGVVNVVGSTIARTCGRGVYVHSGPEIAVASTKAFTSQVTALMVFGLMLARNRVMAPHEGKAFAEALLALPDQVAAYLENPGPIKAAVELIHTAPYILFLGRGFSHAVALEGALKLKEVAYLACEAYPAGEMKHGPIAMMEEGTPVIVVVPDDAFRDKTLSNVSECRARGAKITVIHTEGDAEAAAVGDVSIAVPRSIEPLMPLLTVLPLQLLAYQTAVKLGCDVDKPRNLAKSVTVE